MQEDLDLTGMTLEELDREATWLAGHLAAAEARLVAIVGELDRRDEWLGDGVASPAHWLSWRTGLSPGAARERVRVARALRDLPVLADAFTDGTISYSKVRAATRVATPETDEIWTDFSRSAPAVQIERLAREQARQDSLTPDGAADAHARRRLTWRWDDDGSWVFTARLPPLAAAIVLQALHAALDDAFDARTHRDDPTTGVPAGTAPHSADEHDDPANTHRDHAATGVPAGTPTEHPDTPSAHHQDPAPTPPTSGASSPQGTAVTADRALNLQPLPDPDDQIVTTHDDPDEKIAAARADALVAICNAALAGSRIGRTGADRYRIIIVRHEAPCNPGGMKGPSSGLSQQAGEAGGSPRLEVQPRAASSPDKAGTDRHCQTVRVRRARREGVRMQEPVVEPPQAWNRLEPDGSGPGSSARRPVAMRSATPATDSDVVVGGHGEGLRRSRGEAAGEELDTAPVDRCMVNMGTVRRRPARARPSCGRAGASSAEDVGRDGACVVVRGRESRPHGEGRQQVRSRGTGTLGGRW